MKALVTGGSGFIGRNVVRELVNGGTEVVVIDKNIDGSLIAEMPNVDFRKEDITHRNLPWKSVLSDVDTVYHFAGMLGTSELFDHIVDAEKVNVIGTLNLLEAMRSNDVGKIVFASKPNVWKNNPYTITKEIAERYLCMYYEIYGILPIVLCPYNVYGPEEPLDEYRKAVPYFIVSALMDKPLNIYGDGNQTMDLIHVRDCARAVRSAGNIDYYNPDKIEIGTGHELAVNTLAETIVELTSSKSDIVHVPMRTGEVANTRLCANTNFMNHILSVQPSMKFEDGITDTIEYYRENLKKYIRT
jgi:UDP-glucose 4-epimerase